jgi:hypothetical protein
VYYDGGDAQRVAVKDDETTKLERTLVPGRGNLVIATKLKGCLLSIDGSKVESGEVFDAGIEVKAGKLDLDVTYPPCNEWKATAIVSPRARSRINLADMVFIVPRKDIKVDGKIDDWEGVEPACVPAVSTDYFPKQPGTQVAGCYIARDAKYLYWRLDFSDGSPSVKLTEDFPERMMYTLRVYLDHSDILPFDITFSGGGATSTNVSVWNSATHKSTGLGNNSVSYRIGDGCLEASVPLSLVAKRIGTDVRSFEFNIARAASSGTWGTSWSSHILSIILPGLR